MNEGSPSSDNSENSFFILTGIQGQADFILGHDFFGPVFWRGHHIFSAGFPTGSSLFSAGFPTGHDFFDGRKINLPDPVSWLIFGTP